MRRSLFIIAFVVVLLGAGAVVYFYFFAKAPTLTAESGSSPTLPSAGENTLPATTASSTAPTPVPVTIGSSSHLTKVSTGPVVPGMIVVDTPAKSASSSPSTLVYFIERQSGNVYSYNVSSGVVTRTSNRTIPGIQTARWLPDGSLAYVQYLSGDSASTVNTYALPSDGTNGFFLAQDLADMAVSAQGVLTLASGVNGSVASIQKDSAHQTELFSTPLSSLRIAFVGKNTYLAVTKPSATLAGYAFLVNSSGVLSRIAGPLPGLVALPSPSGKYVLISYLSGTDIQMELITVATRERVPLPVATIADKCVWTTDDMALYCGIPVDPPSTFAYPDDWYQGAVHFSDRIWKIDMDRRYAQLVIDFQKETSDALDAQTLAIDPLNHTLVFINKNDGSFWSYRF